MENDLNKENININIINKENENENKQKILMKTIKNLKLI